MKCVKCGNEYTRGAHYCQSCGAMTAEGEMSLALNEFAKATKHLAKETVRIGKTGIQEIKPNLDGAIQEISKAAGQMSAAMKPAGQKAFEAATAALQLAAQAAENAADEIRRKHKGR